MDMGKAPLVKMDTESFYNKKRVQARAVSPLGKIFWETMQSIKK
jgi:hypothetical protein